MEWDYRGGGGLAFHGRRGLSPIRPAKSKGSICVIFTSNVLSPHDLSHEGGLESTNNAAALALPAVLVLLLLLLVVLLAELLDPLLELLSVLLVHQAQLFQHARVSLHEHICYPSRYYTSVNDFLPK